MKMQTFLQLDFLSVTPLEAPQVQKDAYLTAPEKCQTCQSTAMRGKNQSFC